MYLCGQRALGIGFARALRIGFSHHHQFRWDPNEGRSKISIYDEYPLVGMRFPNIVIRVDGGPALLRGIGGEVAEETSTEITQDGASFQQVSSTIFSGNMRPSVTLEINARSGMERAEIADWAILFLRHFATEKFTNEGVNIQDVQMGGQTEMLLGSDPVFSTSIAIVCLTSFYREVPVSVTTTLRSVCLTGVFTTLPNGVTLTETFS